MESNNQIVVYQTSDGQTAIEVTMEGETVWLSQKQMAELFKKDQSVIARHINNVFKERELEVNSNMQILHNTLSKYKPTQVYSLDVIISVGYRVKSQRGTQFRIWANKVLKDYLLKGYAINQHLAAKKYEELSQLVGIIGRTIQHQPELSSVDSRELISVVTDYTYALNTLDRYDYQQLTVTDTTPAERFHATYDNAMEAIQMLKAKFGESQWFGNEKDESFRSSIGRSIRPSGAWSSTPQWKRKRPCCSISLRKTTRSQMAISA